MDTTISLCMIVKNEEQHLARCLESVKHIVDEIIIVDTGSTDSTKEIAKQYTNKIYDYKWNNDFAAARNESLQHATCDWILVLDADEVIEKGSKKDFLQLMNLPIQFVYQLPILSITENGTETLSYMTRFFKNLPNLRFNGKIHEWLEDSSQKDKKIKLATCSTVQIKHYGYIDTTKKIKRNTTILESLQNQSTSHVIHSYFYLTASYVYEKNYKKALETILLWEKEALKEKIDMSLGYALYLEIMHALEKDQEAIKHVAKYIPTCWHEPRFCVNLAVCYMTIENYEKAIELAKKAIDINKLNVLVLEEKQILYMAHTIIGMCYINIGEHKNSIEYLQKAYDILPNEQIAQILIDVAFQLKDIEIMEKYLLEMKKSFPHYKNINNDILYANILFNKGLLKESVDEFMKLPNGKEYVESIIAGLIPMQRFNDIEKIYTYLQSYQ